MRSAAICPRNRNVPEQRAERDEADPADQRGNESGGWQRSTTRSTGRRDGGSRGRPSVKRAKVDEADEEEDPLVRRKEELVVAAKEARSREDARAERVARRVGLVH